MSRQRYAAGKHAVGECARSGRKMLLRDMVSDGYYPNLLVDPAWREEKHPQEYLPKIEDPTSLYRPSPAREGGPTSPVLSADVTLNAVTLTWTESITRVNQIEEYQVWRTATDSGDAGYLASFALVETVDVERDYKGAITGDPYTYEDSDLDFGVTYSYFVRAVSVRVSEGQTPQTGVADSNIVEATTEYESFTLTVGRYSGEFYQLGWLDSVGLPDGAISPDPPLFGDLLFKAFAYDVGFYFYVRADTTDTYADIISAIRVKQDGNLIEEYVLAEASGTFLNSGDRYYAFQSVHGWEIPWTDDDIGDDFVIEIVPV